MASKPKPFKRPSIDLGRHGRSWKSVKIEDLEPGDIVEGRGLVETVNVADGGGAEVEYWSRERNTYLWDSVVRAFTRDLTEDQK